MKCCLYSSRNIFELVNLTVLASELNTIEYFRSRVTTNIAAAERTERIAEKKWPG